MKLNLGQLEQNIPQARNESGQFFKLSLVFASLGFIVVQVVLAHLFVGQITSSVVSTIASLVTMIEVAEIVRNGEERDFLTRESIFKYSVKRTPPNNRINAQGKKHRSFVALLFAAGYVGR